MKNPVRRQPCACPRRHDPERGLTRRSLLQNLTLGLGAATLAPSLSLRRALAGSPTPPKFLVIVNQFGGCDSLNTWIPYGLGSYYDVRPSLAVPAGDVVVMNPGEGLHPSYAPLEKYFVAGDAAVVRQVGYPDPNLSHFESMDIWSKGVRDLYGIGQTDPRGWIGRAADAYFPGALDVVGVGVGRMPDFVSNQSKPLIVNELSNFSGGGSAVPWWEFEHRDAAVKSMLAAVPANEPTPGKELRKTLKNAYDLVDVIQAAENDYTSAVVYPDNYFAHRLRDVAKLVQAGLNGRIFYTGHGGFDTHGDQDAYFPDLLTETATGIDALALDLQAMGAWDRAAILVISEFGRRNYDNESDGSDHGHGLNVFAFGGAVNGGIYGPAYTNAIVQEEQIPGAVDFRAVLSNVLRRHVGVEPSTTVFPESWSGDQEVPLFS